MVRLDGRSISAFDAFSRAGGYSASLSTLGLGFFEALWDPNRRALHDKIAATVVIRDPRPSPLRHFRRLRERASRPFERKTGAS